MQTLLKLKTEHLEEGQEANYSQRYYFLPGLLFPKRKEITAKIMKFHRSCRP
jgi:hypothetical protein